MYNIKLFVNLKIISFISKTKLFLNACTNAPVFRLRILRMPNSCRIEICFCLRVQISGCCTSSALRNRVREKKRAEKKYARGKPR